MCIRDSSRTGGLIVPDADAPEQETGDQEQAGDERRQEIKQAAASASQIEERLSLIHI